MKNKISKVQKRDGSIVEFDQTRIIDVIFKALTATGKGDGKRAKRLSNKIVKILNRRFKKDEIPHVEQIQDIIEEILILEGLVETAKSYILYREQRRRIREAVKVSEEAVDRIDQYLEKLDWEVQENANMAFSLQGLNNYSVSYIVKKYWLNKIYPEAIREAVKRGDLHLHNLYTLGPYCAGWDLYDLLLKGFGGVSGKVESRPAKHLGTALGQSVNFLYTLQGEVSGAVAFSNFDTLLAPFIRYDNLNYQQVKQALQRFLYNMSVPTRVGFQTPFSNITLDLKPSSEFAKLPVIIGGKPQKETYKEFEEEMKIFDKAFYETMMEGDKNGRPFSIDGACLCPIKNSGKIKLVKIEEYIDKLMEKRKPIFIKENNCQILDVRDLDIKCLGLKERKIDWQKVNFLARHPLDNLLRIWTQGNFSIKVTPSHSVMVLKDGRIQSFEASKLKKGDYLVAPKIVPLGETEILKISLAEEFIKKEKEEGIYIGEVFKENRKRLWQKRIYKNSIGHVSVFPLSWIRDKLNNLDLSEATLNLAGSNIRISNFLPITKELIEFLGWYCAEGSAEKNKKYGGISLGFNLKKEKHIVCHLGNLVKKIWPEVRVTFRDVKERNLAEIRIHSKLLRRIITEIFEIENAKGKKVPEILFELSPEMKKIFLNAYFKGDAWITKDIVVGSTSRELIYGVSTLLKQLGVFHTLTEYYLKEYPGIPRWRINIWQNKQLKPKDSYSISKIPIKESGLEKIVGEILAKEPYYYDSLGRKYKNTKSRIFNKFGIDVFTSTSTSLERTKRVIDYVRKLKLEVPSALKEIEKDNLLFFKIKKIEETKSTNGMVYDFSTESENFVADQFLVHNTFPIPTINITKDFPWDDPAFDPIFEASGKYGTNYFANYINSEMDPSDVRSMCLDGNEEILTRNSKKIKRLPIKEIVQDYKARDFDKEGWAECKKEGNLEILSLNPKTVKLQWSPVKRFLRIFDRKAIEITTKSGKKAVFSLRHPMAIYTPQGIQMKFAKDVNVGEKILEVNSIKAVQKIANLENKLQKEEIKIVEITKIKKKKFKTLKEFYDVELEKNHLFVHSLGQISFNCCRLRLNLKELYNRGGGGLFGSGSLTGCYDDRTELLTENGWKLFKDLSKEDKVFTLTDNNQIESHKPTKLFEYDYQGMMIHFKHKSFDLLVTPNHRMVVDHKGSLKRMVVEAKDFKPYQHYIPKGGVWEGEEKEYFVLPAVLIMGGAGPISRFSEEELATIRRMKEERKSIYKIAENFNCNPVTIYNICTKENYGNRERLRIRHEAPLLKIKMDDWLKFLGFWIAEGCTDNEEIALSHGYRVVITQKNKKKSEEIKKVLNELPFNYYEERNNFVICNKQLWTYLRQFGNKYTKFIPKEIKNLSKRQLKILFDWLVKGDGHVREKTTGQINYWTSSKKLADDLQEIILKLGWMGTLTFREGRVARIRGRKIKGGINYNIGVQKTRHYVFRPSSIKELNYKGKVYCCQVKNHTLFVRRNGKVTWSGNSIGVVTINLPRIGFLSKTKKEFFERLGKMMDLAQESLEIKRKTIENFIEKGLYPYSKFYLEGVKKMRGEYYANHFSTIGLVGMNEALLNFIGENIASRRGRRFALEIMDFMRKRLVKYQKETKNIYNLEATPAESTAYRLALKDKEKYPDIITAGTKKNPYYTNSSQLPVNYTNDIFEALKLQDEIQCKYTGGTVLHLFLGERINNIQTVKNLVRKVFENFKLPYITLTPTFSICPVHGYLEGEHFFCPKCTIKQPCEVYTRIVGYLRPVSQFNIGKQQEFKQRKEFKIKKSELVKT